ncbi:hypothetical protein LINGRAHAP2_LOCUS11016, partial [Linum grandiflorum]
QSEAMDLVDEREQCGAAVVACLQVTSAVGFNSGGSIDGRGLQVYIHFLAHRRMVDLFSQARLKWFTLVYDCLSHHKFDC